MKTKYCLGFMFDAKEYGVLLIEKQKPSWQKGMFNGIGGKIEPGEDSYVAMRREFKEETGIDCQAWKYVTTFGNDDWQVEVFMTRTDDVHNFRKMEDEEPIYIPLAELDQFNIITNLTWLIPMCLDVDNVEYSISNNKHSAPAPSPLSEAVRELDSLERNNEKINQHTWETYKEQISLHIRDLRKMLSTPCDREVKIAGEAVAFADWIVNEDYIPTWPSNQNKGKWRNSKQQEFTTGQLYKQFLQSIKQQG